MVKQLFDRYVEQGELPGSVSAAVLNQNPADFIGVEDWNLYSEGIRLYREAMENEPAILKEMTDRKTGLGEKKKTTYSKALFDIDAVLNRFDENKSDLFSLLKKLSGVKPPEPDSKIAALLLTESKIQNDSVKKINDLGTTVILTTHNKGVIDALRRRVITMDKGRIVRDDKEGRYVL